VRILAAGVLPWKELKSRWRSLWREASAVGKPFSDQPVVLSEAGGRPMLSQIEIVAIEGNDGPS